MVHTTTTEGVPRLPFRINLSDLVGDSNNQHYWQISLAVTGKAAYIGTNAHEAPQIIVGLRPVLPNPATPV